MQRLQTLDIICVGESAKVGVVKKKKNASPLGLDKGKQLLVDIFVTSLLVYPFTFILLFLMA